MKFFFQIFLGLFLISFGMALNYDVIANLYHQIEIMERSLESEFKENYSLRCEIADRNRVPKWAPSKYQVIVKKEEKRR